MTRHLYRCALAEGATVVAARLTSDHRDAASSGAGARARSGSTASSGSTAGALRGRAGSSVGARSRAGSIVGARSRAGSEGSDVGARARAGSGCGVGGALGLELGVGDEFTVRPHDDGGVAAGGDAGHHDGAALEVSNADCTV